MRTIRLFAAVCLAAWLGPRLTSEPGVYDVTVQPVHTLGREQEISRSGERISTAQLMQNLDDALHWVEQEAPAS